MEKTSRKTIQIPADIHAKLKIDATVKGEKLFDYIAEILRKSIEKNNK